ncbi:MAG: recombinase family protein [Tepidisphaeraceae bacterium]
MSNTNHANDNHDTHGIASSIVIYTRYSDPHLQRQESLEAQELKVRQQLDYLGIDHGQALLLREGGQRGDLEARGEYDRLLTMIAARRVKLLAVDQQSRFSRGYNVRGLITDLVYGGGRFIAVGDGIDTDRPGWQDLVGLKEIHNQMEIRDTGWRVRRSQEQRVASPDGSAGDFPYGYTSEYVDSAAALGYRGRGPKPAKRVVIDPAAAAVVREVFKRFTDDGESISAVVRWWDGEKEQFPRIGKGHIHHQHVRRILTNPKYVGRWSFGKTTTVRNSKGQKKQIAARSDQKVVMIERPELRIIDQQTYDKAQARLAELMEVFGMKAAGKKRGPAQHYKLLYEKSLLGGLVTCGACGSRMVTQSASRIKKLGCPKHRVGACTVVSRVPYAKAEAQVLSLVTSVLANYPEWITAVADNVRQQVRRLSDVVPAQVQEAQARAAELEKEIDNLVAALAKGLESDAVRQRLARAEAEKARVRARLADLEQLRTREVEMPNDAWLAGELAKLAELMKADLPRYARILREVVGMIVAEEVKAKGKKRGFIRLHLKLRGWPALSHLLEENLSPALIAALKATGNTGGASGDLTIDLGTPSAIDRWGEQIVRWRRENVTWKEITSRTGLSLFNAWAAWRRLTGEDADLGGGGGRAA